MGVERPSLIRLSGREALYPEIKRLREDESLTWREIGERLGISLKTAHDYYTDPTGEVARDRHRRYDATPKASAGWRRRARTEAYRGRCEDCGGLKGIDSEKSGYGRCRPCEFIRRKAMHEFRLQLIHGMYEDGWTYADMSAAMGWRRPEIVSPYICELRTRGLVGRRR
jgi:hypothetical protein